MILELRTYDYAPGNALKYLDIFNPEGLPLITSHLPLAGYWLSEVGALNRLRHLWVYKNLEERTERRAKFMSDTNWTEGFLPRGMALITRQTNQFIELTEVSNQAREVFENPVPHQGWNGPHLRDGWAALNNSVREDALFSGRVISGEGIGSTISISNNASLPAFELMRPCAYSPL